MKGESNVRRYASKKSIKILLTGFLIFSLCLCGCKSTENAAKYKIKIAEQYGLAYAPISIMKQNKIMEKNLPGLEVSWQQLGNTAAIREAMLSNNLDVGFMAIPPFLIGWDKGMEWKIASGLSASPIGLITYRDDIQSIKDFSENDRIALPQPGSIQHILLSMACEKEFGNAQKYDDILVTMSHPDGMNTLLTQKDITAHFTSPPYIFKELENKDMHQILSGKEAMGKDFTFIVGATTQKFHDDNPEVYQVFVKSLNEAIDFIQNNPQEAAKTLSSVYDLPEEEVLNYISQITYENKIRGLNEFAAFLSKNDYISKNVTNLNDVLWEDANYVK